MVPRMSSRSSKRLAELAEALLESRAFAKVEAYGTAFLSIADMCTDLVMIIKFYDTDRIHFALATIICISLNVAISSLCTYFIHTKKPWWKQIREQM